MLKLDSVAFHYPQTSFRYLFDLQTGAGTITAITGKSGSGKSTLLDLIAGFIPAESGEIVWHDQHLTQLPPAKRPITTVFQRNNLFEHRNAIDNVIAGINPRIPASGADYDAAADALAAVGLSGFEKQRASQLSGGQQQRVAIARAIARKTPIIQFDEPFSALDQETREQMLELVRSLATTHQCAVLMVTHNIADCDAIADSRYEIRDGRLITVTAA